MKKVKGLHKFECMIFMLLVLCMSQAFAAQCGDVNNNGVVDIVDALLIAQYYVGLNPPGFDPSVADVNANGSVDIVDALLISQYYVGLISTLSCPSATAAPTAEPTATPGVATISGNQVIVIGESFIAMSHEITQDVQTYARNAGILPSGQNFIDNATSGMRLSGGGSPTIPQQYANGNTGKTVRWAIMDGGGNDCLGGSCSTPPTSSCTDLVNAANAARTLLTQMGNDGVTKVIWFWYPDPQQDLGGLAAKLAVLKPMIQSIVTSSTKPKCYWLELAPVFAGHYSQYIQGDGIHPTSAGCQAAADAIWNVIQQNNFFSTN
jgi:hypothetical protein